MTSTEAAARALHDARSAGRAVQPLPEAIRPADLAEGYAVQHALAGLQGALPPAGFKVGGTAAAMRAWLGLGEPMAGFMRADTLLASDATVRMADFHAVGVECEIALRLGQDLPPRATPYAESECAAAVAAWFPAIEIVDNRYALTAVELGAPTIVADQVFHAAAVLGAPAGPGFDLTTLVGVMTACGVERGRGRGADLLGGPLTVLAWLASLPGLAPFGGLRRGQVVMCGSVCPPVWLDGPGDVVADFGAFGRVTLRVA